MADELLMQGFMLPGDDAFDCFDRFLDAMRRPSWHADAACRGMNTALFMTGNPSPKAEAVCAACPVSAECFDAAMAHGDVGTWGGTHTADRTALRRRSKAA